MNKSVSKYPGRVPRENEYVGVLRYRYAWAAAKEAPYLTASLWPSVKPLINRGGYIEGRRCGGSASGSTLSAAMHTPPRSSATTCMHSPEQGTLGFAREHVCACTVKVWVYEARWQELAQHQE